MVGHDHYDVAHTYMGIAIVYGGQGHDERALEYHHKSLDIKIKVGNWPLVAASYYNLAGLFAARDSTLCRDMLLKAEQTGQLYLLKEHMKTDSDMDPVRELEWYKDLAMRL